MSFAPVRRNQLIAPFGPGALVVLPDGGTSVIVGAIDQWFRSTGPDRPLMEHPFGGYQDRGREHFHPREFMIDEWRLTRHLKVDCLMAPPDHRPAHRSQAAKNAGLTVPAYRFPQWHVCSDSRCRQMTRLPLTCIKPPKCPSCGAGRLVQVRFIAVCPRGHIQDFPWNEWLHGLNSPTCPGRLVYSESGMGGTMGISVSCKLCGVKPRSLAGVDSIIVRGDDPSMFATRLSLQLDKAAPFTCQGSRPWTGDERPQGHCGCHLVTVQRNAGNVYFPCVTSALFVPRVGDSGYMDERTREVHAALMPLIHMFKDLEMLPVVLTGEWLMEQKKTSERCRAHGWTVEDVRKAVPFMLGQGTSTTAATVQPSDPDEDDSIQLKRPEYPLLRGGCEHAHLRVSARDPSGYGPIVANGFTAISLVESLCETRALTGFSRILPEPAGGQTRPEERRGLLHGPDWPCTWLPGCQVFGEGIFLELDAGRIAKWLSTGAAELEHRVEMVRKAYAAQRGDEAARRKPLDPVFLLLHSLAHLLINRLTRECGYSTASLRERIYRTVTGTPMHGLLIYTAAGDSEGTMGGLVRMGRAGKFESVLADAIEEARWCAADPVCRELGAEGRGPDPCNLAACHNCLLVPETSCEEFNRFLDRGMVVGTLGYWS